MDITKLAKDLKANEGLRLFPYRDTVGCLTVGFGHNLSDGGISRDIAESLLAEDIGRALLVLERHLPWWVRLDDVRQRVLCEMAFNLGDRLITFVKMLEATQQGRYDDAAAEMLRSTWARQVKGRADRLADMMRTGEDAKTQ